MARLPLVKELYGGDPSLCDSNGNLKPGKLADRHEQVVKAMTAAVSEGVSGGVMTIPQDNGLPLVKSRKTYQRELNQALQGSGNVSKSLIDPAAVRLQEFLDGPSATAMSKEWSLSTPINTGLVPYDLPIGVSA